MDTTGNEIIGHAVVMQTDGFVGYYPAVCITKEEVIIGRITDNRFISYGGIPIQNVKRIEGYDKDHNLKEIKIIAKLNTD